MDSLERSALWAGIAAAAAIIGFVITMRNKKKAEKEEKFVPSGEEQTVTGEKLIVYNKSNESTGILAELEIGTKYIIYKKTNFGGFYKVSLANGQIGYVHDLHANSKL